MSHHLSKQKSESLYNKFIDWRNKLLDLTKAVIIVEGKRDIEVLTKLGVTEGDNSIIGYSQKSSIEVEELLSQDSYKECVIVPLVDFDRQGEEYLAEIRGFPYKIDLELRLELRNFTRGKLIEFEDLFYLLENKLHPNYWLVLCQTLHLPD